LKENTAVYDRILKAVRTKIGLERSGPHSGAAHGGRPGAAKTASA
jgi:hypothetical protein